jgi:uncharacterized protein (TIGR03086 family)
VRALDSTQRYVAGIRDSQWTSSTPCTEWNVRQLVNHLVYEYLWAKELMNGKTIQEVGDRFEDKNLLGRDPRATYNQAAKEVHALFAAPGAMRKKVHLGRGDAPAAQYAGEMFLDTLIHGWDLAKATGQDTRLDPELVAACYAMVEGREKELAGSGVFGKAVRVPPRASQQTKLLAVLGRRA